MRSQLEKLTEGQEYHLFYPKSETRFGWLTFGLAGIILTMKEADVEVEHPPQKSPQELSAKDYFKMVFHLNPGEIVDLGVIAQKLSQLQGRKDLTTKSQSIRELLDLDVFFGDESPWKMLVPTLAQHSVISPCKCDIRSEQYEQLEFIQACPFEVQVPKKMPKHLNLTLQTLIDMKLSVESVLFQNCDGCKHGKVQNESVLKMMDGAKGIIINIIPAPMSKQAKKKNLKSKVQIEDIIEFNNYKTDSQTPPQTYYQLVCALEEGTNQTDQTFKFKSRGKVVTISNGEEMKLGNVQDFETCQIFFFKNIGHQHPDDCMEFDLD